MNNNYSPQGRRSYKDASGNWDELIVEAAILIKINELELSNIRTPGEDVFLVKGFLLTEGFIPHLENIKNIRLQLAQGSGREDDYDQIEVSLNSQLATSKYQRSHEIRPSCGLCGDSSLPDNIASNALSLTEKKWDLNKILKSPDILRKQQGLFSKTGACHAAAIFNKEGELLFFAEDVGRHNAVDKVIGKAADAHTDLSQCYIFLSGRCGYELIAKAVRVGLPLVASVSGTTSMSLDLAKKHHVTLISFCRNNSARVYNDPGRLTHSPQPPSPSN